MTSKEAEIVEETARLREQAREALSPLRTVLAEAEALERFVAGEAARAYEAGASWRRVSAAAAEARGFAGTIRGALAMLEKRGEP